MIDKIKTSAAEALADVKDGATVMIGGFGTAGMPFTLIDALIAQGAKISPSSPTMPATAISGLAATQGPVEFGRSFARFPSVGFVGVRRPLSIRQDRARGGAAG
jgi:3-oxoadipate CoA-transferase alpha subunit